MAHNGSGDRESVAAALRGLFMTAARLQDRKLSMTAAGVIDTVDRRGPCRITQLAASEGVAQPSMTAMVMGLERAGLVERRKDPADLRVVLVALTPAGRKYINRQRNHLSVYIARLMEEVSDEEFEALLAAKPALDHLWELSAKYASEYAL